MRVLVIGGTRFIGPAVVDELLRRGHEVTLFHRTVTTDGRGDVAVITGDRKSIADHAEALQAAAPDVVVDMIAMTEADARGALDTFRGVAGRIVVLSSGDVYRAFGRINGIEDGPVEAGSLTEDAPLRLTRFPYPEQAPEYEKILVEEMARSEPELPATILRLPMVYGQRDYQHRYFDWVKRMDDTRPAILIEKRFAAWRFARAHVENVARAVGLAVDLPKSAGRTFNVAEPTTPTVAESVADIGTVMGWKGEIRTLDTERCPEHLRREGHYAQNLVMDSTRIREELGYREAITRAEAIRKTVDWQRRNPPAEIDPKRFDYAAEDRALGG
ncbi:MAG: NAD-dependent epimerase/dehydratase family protein [Planctomycetota bacterium]|jgi:nucleoside-diphosphate-sugar epimerase